MVMTPREEAKEEKRNEESPPSWCPRCEAKNERMPVTEGNISLRIVKGVTYRLEEVVCRSCGLFYVNARTVIGLKPE